MDDCLEQVMTAMGWSVDSDIPMANAENKRLLDKLKQLNSERVAQQVRYKEALSRVEKIQEHSKNAENSVTQKMQLLMAHQEDARTEAHLYQVARREHDKLKEDLKNLQKDADNIKKLTETMDKELCKRRQNIDKKTSRVQWAKNALIEWREAMEDGNKGYQLIEKYFKEDEVKAREENQRRQTLQNEIDKCRKELVVLYDEQKCLEQNLASIAKLYRDAHVERRQMIETWKTAVQQMNQRERDIQEGEMTLLQLTRNAKLKGDEQKRYNSRLDAIIEGNRNVERTIEELNSDTSDLRERMQNLINMIALRGNEVDLLQKDLVNLANRVQQQRMENRRLTKDKGDKLKQLENFADLILKIQDRYIKMQDKNATGQQRLQVLEEMNNVEEKAHNEIFKETNRINGLLHRSEQQLIVLKDEQKMLEISNDGIKVTIVAIEKNMQNREKDLHRRTEVHYSLGFKCLEAERSVIKLQGGVVDPEDERRKMQQLAELEEEHSKTIRRQQAVEMQNTKLDFTMRKLTSVYNADNEQLELIHFKVKEALVYCEGGVKRLKTEQTVAHSFIVELSILRMRANEFENEIAKCESSAFNLRKHRARLNEMMKNRMTEIMSQLDLLNRKRKHLDEEKGTLRADVGERNKHIEAMRARFELTVKLLGTNEDGSLVTATQLKVETAQEKQILLEQGNELNKKVLKAEEEILAMENTLMVLNDSNEVYRKKTNQVLAEEDLVEQLRKAEKEHCAVMQQMKEARERVLNIENEKSKTLTLKERYEEELQEAKEKTLETTDIVAKMEAELRDQQMKIERANRALKVAIKEAKQRGVNDDLLTHFERELDLRQLEQHNMSALNKLSEMAEEDGTGVGGKVIKALTDRGIELPRQIQRTQSLISWRSVMSTTSRSSSSTEKQYTCIRERSTARGGRERGQQSLHAVSVQSINFPG